MAERSSDFRDTLLELIEESPEPMDHPSPDRWLAYHRGELPEDEETRLQEHLARCRDCFDLAEAAAAFAEPEKPDAGQEVETAARWRLLRPQLGPSPGNVRAISAGPRWRPSWRFRLPSSVAALFLVALLGLSVWNLQQRSVIAALHAPQPNVAFVDLPSGERAAGGREQTVPAGTRMLVFSDKDLPAYRLAIREAATGKEVWSGELRPNRDSVLTLLLPEEFRPGRYRLELSDARGGKVLETHLLRVTEGRGD